MCTIIGKGANPPTRAPTANLLATVKHMTTASRRDRTAVWDVKVTAPVHAHISVSVLQFLGSLTLTLGDAFQCQECLLACQWAALVQLLSDHNNGHPPRMTC